MTQASHSIARSAQSVKHTAAGAFSFTLGMIAALPELMPARIWYATRPAVAAIKQVTPRLGRFHDGYDLVCSFIRV